MKDQLTITFKCLECGGAIIELPDNPTDDSIAKCKACGQEFGRFGDVKKKAMDAAADKVLGLAKAAFADVKRKLKLRR